MFVQLQKRYLLRLLQNTRIFETDSEEPHHEQNHQRQVNVLKYAVVAKWQNEQLDGSLRYGHDKDEACKSQA